MTADGIRAARRVPVVNGGVCIYCGWGGGSDGLGDEHILPYSLGGDSVLERASCARCGAITSYLEGYLANAIFGHFRVHQKLQSRSGHPSELPIIVEREDRPERVVLPVERHPFFLNMPVWGMPGMMVGLGLDCDFGRTDKHAYYHLPATMRSALDLKEGEEVRIVDTLGPLNVPTFARALLKIAYCSGVATYGLNNFRPFAVPDIILGRYSNIAYFVGTELDLPPPEVKPPGQHIVQTFSLQFNPHGRPAGDHPAVLYSRIRLFCDSGYKQHGMPIYRVIFGFMGKRQINPSRPLPKRGRVIAL